MTVVEFKKPGEIEVGFTYFYDSHDNVPKVIEQTFDEMAAAITHVVGPKDGAAISAALFDGKRGSQYVIARIAVILDVEANKHTGEIPPTPEQVAERVAQVGWRAVIYTSHSHTTYEPRMRVLVAIDRVFWLSQEPEQRAVDLDLDRYAILLVADRLGLGGVIDGSKLTPASLFYLARAPQDRIDQARVINIPGRPIKLDTVLQKAGVLRDEAEEQRRQRAEAATRRAAERRASYGEQGDALLGKLRQVMPTLEDAFLARGYRYFKRMDRWLHPNSSTGIPGIQVFKGDDGVDRFVSWHGCDPLEASTKAFGTGAHDVVDLEIAWRWGTGCDLREAIKMLCKEFGIATEAPPENLDEFEVVPGATVFNEATITAAKRMVVADRFLWITYANGTTPVINGNWLIKRLLPADGLGVIFGRPGSGKTFSVMDLALHVAAGLPWRKLKVNQADVSYISPEAGRLGANRVIGWMKHHNAPWPAGFRLSPAQIDLCSTDDDAEALIADIKQNQPNCRLVVIDTLNRAMAGGDENDGQDMGKFVRLCDMIAKALSCFVLVVHHSGKDAARGSRGHSSLLGAISAEFEVTREQGQPGTIKVTKMRDGEDGAEYGFNLTVEPLGVDEDGDEVTTAVVIEADAGEARAAREARPTGKNQLPVADAFDQYIVDAGRPNPPGIGHAEPGRVMLVDLDPFIEFAAGKLIGGALWERRKTVKDAIRGLVRKDYFCVNDNKIWKPR
jgi:hypothetical protein